MFLDLGLPTLIGPVAVMAHVAIAALVTVHILLYKRNVAASVSWIGIAWLSLYAVTVHRLRAVLGGPVRRVLDAVTGLVLVALGIRVAAAER